MISRLSKARYDIFGCYISALTAIGKLVETSALGRGGFNVGFSITLECLLDLRVHACQKRPPLA